MDFYRAASLFGRHLAQGRPRRSVNTRRAYRLALEHAGAWFEDRGITDTEAITTAHLEAYDEHQKALKFGGTDHARRQRFGVLRTMMEWLRQNQGTQADPFEGFALPSTSSTPVTRHRRPTSKTIAAIKGDEIQDHRDRAILQIMLELQVAAADVARMDADDYDPKAGEVRIGRSWHVLSAKARRLMDRYIEARNAEFDATFLWVSASPRSRGEALAEKSVRTMLRARCLNRVAKEDLNVL